jgi:hypothetical protein
MSNRNFDELRVGFARGLVAIAGGLTVIFGLELFWELRANGYPPLSSTSWAGVLNNSKLVDILSPVARAYNNVLAMLLATIGLAIPLTANMHTPKLIDLFLKDWVNRIVLTLGAAGAAHVLWVAYITGPNFAPIWAFRAAVFGSIVGWFVLIPYFFYVVRFLDPSVIIRRLRNEVTHCLQEVAEGKRPPEQAQDEIQDLLFQIGTIVIKAFDRADRSVAQEGVWALRQVVRVYGEVKPRMGDDWFLVGRSDFVGMSHHAIQMINQKRTWMEMHVLYQLVLCYRHALGKAPDEISTISNVTRRIAVEAERREDRHAVSLAIRVFNTLLRDALNRHDSRATFDVFYQYRQLAAELSTDARFVKRIGGFFVVYANLADDLGCTFASDLAGFDLEHVVETTYLQKSEAADDVLAHFLSLSNVRGGRVVQARVRAKLIAGAFFAEQKLGPQLDRIKHDLAAVPPSDLQLATQRLVSVQKRAYWEITDRAVNIEWTDKARRRQIRALADELMGVVHGAVIEPHGETTHEEHEDHEEHDDQHGLFVDALVVPPPATSQTAFAAHAMVDGEDGA